MHTKNAIATAALAAKMGTCAPGSLVRTGKNPYAHEATHHKAGVGCEAVQKAAEKETGI